MLRLGWGNLYEFGFWLRTNLGKIPTRFEDLDGFKDLDGFEDLDEIKKLLLVFSSVLMYSAVSFLLLFNGLHLTCVFISISF